ncbi:GNAT family N-acetyltransferase [Kribbella sandramycini]|uniref:GNAT family N-acetyltransferase n=1 Tax=Kribbella sandramycini TaxID=60450 RepID=A0A7Y4L3C3_9ACTN|nr:GNAT family N-acetyltransferase [Kribbella sandramycini]MBB6570970.1 GNAT superfamily N-acetyltransferase [Kribbella sandramycini]NOL43620.1 GNAT family N-acetyltransferase [Kribbella sandramycini]
MKYVVVEPEEALAPGLRADLLDTWVAATDAGGAVGFTAPAPVEQVAQTLDDALGRVASGLDLLGVLHDGDRYVGMGLLVDRGGSLHSHWRTVLRVMVHPKYQGSGAGRTLMEGLRGSAHDLGLEQLQLTIRDGLGLENFYQPLGYRIVGRHPRAIRLTADDYRDEVMLVRDL